MKKNQLSQQSPFQPENVPFNIKSYRLSIREKVNTGELFSFLQNVWSV